MIGGIYEIRLFQSRIIRGFFPFIPTRCRYQRTAMFPERSEHSAACSGFDAGADEGRFSLGAPPCWRIPPVNRRQLQLIIMMMEQRYRRAGGDVIPCMPVAGGANRCIRRQGCEKFLSAMELGKTATHRQLILLCRHGQSIASATWRDLEPGVNFITH